MNDMRSRRPLYLVVDVQLGNADLVLSIIPSIQLSESDSNANPTGDMRQIQYKLVDGEASRLFKIDKILEFPTQ